MTSANLAYKRVSSKPIRRPLRAIVEIIDGELNVLPVAESDVDERQVLDALTTCAEWLRQQARALA